MIDYRLPIISLLSNKIGKIRMKYKYEHETIFESSGLHKTEYIIFQVCESNNNSIPRGAEMQRVISTFSDIK